MNRFLYKFDFFISLCSWLTMLLLCTAAIVQRFVGYNLGSVLFSSCLGTVAVAAAVGYLTNYVAIWLLFKPYHYHFGIQGVIPRNKEKLGVALGEQIPRYLLKPEELAEQLGQIVSEYLQNRALLEEMRSRTNRFLNKYSANIADFLFPYLEQAMRKIVQDNLTTENLSLLYEQLAADWLNNSENTERLASAISHELQKRAPFFSEQIRKNSAPFMRAYMQEEHPTLCALLSADNIAARLVNDLNWGRLEEQIQSKLEGAETRLAIQRELLSLTFRLQQYLRSERAAHELKAYLDEKQRQVEDICRQFLIENIPCIVDQWLSKDEFWLAVEQRMLPLLQALFLSRLEKEKLTIIKKLRLPEKIEDSVRKLDMEELHSIINKVSGEHLVAIQLLGYFLGAFAGALLMLTRMSPG